MREECLSGYEHSGDNKIDCKDRENKEWRKLSRVVLAWSTGLLVLYTSFGNFPFEFFAEYILAVVFSLVFLNKKTIPWLYLQIPVGVLELRRAKGSGILDGLGGMAPCFIAGYLGTSNYTLRLFLFLKSCVFLWFPEVNVFTAGTGLSFWLVIGVLLDYSLDLFAEYLEQLQKESSELKFNIQNFPASLVFTNFKWKITDHNRQAMSLMRNRTLSDIRGRLFERLFEESSQVKIRKLLEKAFKGEVSEEEVLMAKDAFGIGLMVSAGKVKFEEDCIVAVLSDVSNYQGQRELVFKIGSETTKDINNILKAMEEAIKDKRQVNDDDLACFRNFLHKVRCASVLQGHFQACVEFTSDHFSILKQMQYVMETNFLKAKQKSIELILKKTQNTPSCVFADPLIHSSLLNSIVQFAISEAIPNTKVHFEFRVAVRYTQDKSSSRCTLQYKVSFRSDSIFNSELDRIFQVRADSLKRKSFERISKEFETYGLGITVVDTLLALTFGYVESAKVQENSGSQINIILK